MAWHASERDLAPGAAFLVRGHYDTDDLSDTVERTLSTLGMEWIPGAFLAGSHRYVIEGRFIAIADELGTQVGWMSVGGEPLMAVRSEHHGTAEALATYLRLKLMREGFQCYEWRRGQPGAGYQSPVPLSRYLAEMRERVLTHLVWAQRLGGGVGGAQANSVSWPYGGA